MRQLFWLNFRHYLRRLFRDPFSLLMFTALPILLVLILGYVYTRNSTEELYVNGYNMASTYLSMGMMLMFQSSSGIFLLACLNHDLVGPMRWRLHASPCATRVSVFSAAAACLIFTILQGLVIVACTAWFLDVYWGNIWITMATILIISVISQLISMILLMFTRNVSAADYVLWGVSWASAILGGFMFPLPDHAFFRFMERYGTPFSLSLYAIQESGFLGTSIVNSLINLAILGIVTVAMGVVVVLLGRRRLA